MAVKASATITLSFMIDIKATYRYYKLQSSTASAPSKPTANPPSGWTDAEPTYTSGSTNTLYFVDLTVFTDNAFSYSAVSKSTSYEAAKEAYNKAVAANTTANSANNTANSAQASLNSYMASNMIRNGFGEEKNNNNFTSLTFVGADVYNNVPSFQKEGFSSTVYFPNELLPIDLSKTYEFSMNIKATGSEKIYLGWDEYDIDKLYIYPHQSVAFPGIGSSETTTLARDLKNGDTVVYLTSAAGWKSTTATHQLGLIFWNYKDSTGYQYPEGVYSRNAWVNLYTFANVNTTNNTITLNSAWTNGTFTAGTRVSQTSSAGHKYRNYGNTVVPTEWASTSFEISGVQDPFTHFDVYKFNPATRYVKFVILHNYNNWSTRATTHINSVRFVDKTMDSKVDDVIESVDIAQNTASSAEARVAAAELDIDSILGQIATLVTDANGTSLMTQTSNGWTFSMAETQNAVDSVSKSLDELTNGLGTTDATVEVLRQAVSDLEGTAEYVRVITYEDEPCIELGESDSEFKLLITNTRIMFMDGSNVPTYISKTGLTTENIEVKNALRQGNFIWAVRSNGNYGLSWVNN